MEAKEYRKSIITSLKARNKLEIVPFKEMMMSYYFLNDKVFGLTSQNMALSVENGRLREEMKEMSFRVENSGSAKNYNFEQKVFKLQEEVTELHRQKSHLAEQVIELNKSSQDKDRTIQSRTHRIAEMDGALSDQQTTSRQCLDKLKELECTNTTLKDELCANHLALVSVEEKHRQLSDDYSNLLRQFMQQKDRLVDKMNEEFDAQFKMKQDTIRKDLQEAASTYVSVEESRCLPVIPVTFSVSVPTKVEDRIDAHDGEVNCVRWTSSGKMFASGGSDRRLKLWSVVNGHSEVRGTLIGSNAGITAIDFDSEENYVMGASNDFACRIWSLVDHRLRHTFTGHANKVVAARFMGEESKVVTGSSDRTLKLWDLRSRACVKTMLAMSACNDVVVCAPMRLMISGHFDKKLRLWDHRGEQITDQIALPGRITGLDISKVRKKREDDDRKLAELQNMTKEDSVRKSALRKLREKEAPVKEKKKEAASKTLEAERRLQKALLDLQDAHKLLEKEIMGGCDIQNQGKIKVDMTYVLACTRDDTLRTIDLRMNQVVQCYQSEGFRTAIDNARPCFSPDGQFVCAGSNDGAVYVWNTKSGAIEKTLKEHNSTVVCVDWNPVRNAIASCDRQKKIILWNDS